MPVDVAGVVSNHETQRRLVEWHGLPYHHLPIELGRKEEQEARLLELFTRVEADLLVLARYMQILTNSACWHLRFRSACLCRASRAGGVEVIRGEVQGHRSTR